MANIVPQSNPNYFLSEPEKYFPYEQKSSELSTETYVGNLDLGSAGQIWVYRNTAYPKKLVDLSMPTSLGAGKLYILKNNTYYVNVVKSASGSGVSMVVSYEFTTPLKITISNLNKSINVSYRNYNNETSYPCYIKIGNRIAFIMEEIDTSISFFNTNEFPLDSLQSILSKKYFDLYEPISKSNINFSSPFNLKIYNLNVNTAVKSLSFNDYTTKSFRDLSELESNLSINYELPEYYVEDQSGIKTIDFTINSNSKIYINDNSTNENQTKLIFTVNDFANKRYEIQEKNLYEYKIYIGKQVSDDFLNAFEIHYIRSNSYKTLDTVTYNALELSKMSKTIMYESDNSFEFNYNLTTDVVLSYIVNKNIIRLDTGNLKFRNLTIKNIYKKGEILDLTQINIKEAGNLAYTDNSGISLNDIEYVSAPYATSSLIVPPDSSIEINNDTPASFTITYNIPTKYYGNLTYTFNVAVEGYTPTFISSARFKEGTLKTNFKYNEVIDYGENAVIECLNPDNQVVKTIPYSEFNSFLTRRDSLYGKIFSDINDSTKYVAPTNDVITLYSYSEDFELIQKIKVSFATSLSLNFTSENTNAFFNETTDTLITSNITGTILYNDNTGDSTVVKNISVENSNLVFSLGELNTTINSPQRAITVSTTYENKTLIATYRVNYEKIRPVIIYFDGTSNSLTYWDNGLQKFVIPTQDEINFYIKWNYPENTIDKLNNATDIEYFYDSNFTNQIIPNESYIQNTNEYIYFRHKVYTNLTGSLHLTIKKDNIINLLLTNDVTFTLGNKLIDCKNLFNIKAVYESGLQEDENFLDYSFVKEDYVLESTDIIIKYNNENYTLDKSKIIFVNPSISNIVINASTFRKSYNNEFDYIDVRSITLLVSYNNATFTNLVTTYTKNEIVNKNEFKVFNDRLTSDFNYDGSSLINISFEVDEVTATIPLTFTVPNYFDISEVETTTLNIDILTITNIIGLSLKKAKTDYYTGETFLNENDDTSIYIWYLDTENKQRKISIDLKNGFGGLNIEPQIGYKFVQTNRAQNVKITAVTNPQISLEYTIAISPKYNYTDINTILIRAYKVSSYTLPNGKEVKDKYLLISEEDKASILDGSKTLENCLVYGYLEDINDKSKSCRVILFNDYIPPVEGANNINVKFPCYVEGNADKINHCHFGKLFGNNNAKNRLFLSGNKNIKNCDWHSGAINTSKQEGDNVSENGDFTYFEDTSYCFYGQTDNEIIGYDIISYDKMVVLKSKSDKESTIYFRTNGLIEAIDGSGNKQVGINNETLYQESYPLVIGNIGVGALSNKSITNFNGDTLFISSDNHIDGLDATGVIGDTQRYANTRSYFIDPKLEKLDLSKAELWNNNKYLFLCLKDETYLAYFNKITDTKQYEWWKLDIKDIQTLIEIDNKIYFGNSLGQFYKLENNIYKDINKIFINKGGCVVNNNNIIVSKNIIDLLDENKEYEFEILSDNNDYESYLYYKIANLNNVKINNVEVYVNRDSSCLQIVGLNNNEEDYEKCSLIYSQLNEKDLFYLNHTDNDSSIVIDYSHNDANENLAKYGKAYRIKHTDLATFSFVLIDNETNEVVNTNSLARATLVKRVDFSCKIKDINKENSSFKLANDNKELNFVQYGKQNYLFSFKAIIKEFNNVKAYYITAPFTMGNLLYNKTIWGWTLTNDTNIPSSIEVCQATNDKELDDMISLVDFGKNDYGFSFSNFDTKSMSFDKYVVPHKYTFYRPILTSFICFAFRNNDGNNAVLSSLQVIYTVPSTGIGKY